MLDFTCIFLLSLGLTTAKTDLNSDQPYSHPTFFSEASLRLQKRELRYCGVRVSYYNTNVRVRDLWREELGPTHDIHYLVYSLYIGHGVRLDQKNYMSLDLGISYIMEDDKIGAPARLRYTREVRTRKKKRFNLSASLGMDYWVQDDLDQYEDVTTRDGDFMLHLTFGVGFPINEPVVR